MHKVRHPAFFKDFHAWVKPQDTDPNPFILETGPGYVAKSSEFTKGDVTSMRPTHRDSWAIGKNGEDIHIAALPRAIPLFQGQQVIEGSLGDQDVFNSICHLHKLGEVWAESIHEKRLIEERHWEETVLHPPNPIPNTNDSFSPTAKNGLQVTNLLNEGHRTLLEGIMDQCIQQVQGSNPQSTTPGSTNNPNNLNTNNNNSGMNQFSTPGQILQLHHQLNQITNNSKQSAWDKSIEKIKRWVQTLYATRSTDPSTPTLLEPATITTKFQEALDTSSNITELNSELRKTIVIAFDKTQDNDHFLVKACNPPLIHPSLVTYFMAQKFVRATDMSNKERLEKQFSFLHFLVPNRATETHKQTANTIMDVDCDFLMEQNDGKVDTKVVINGKQFFAHEIISAISNFLAFSSGAVPTHIETKALQPVLAQPMVTLARSLAHNNLINVWGDNMRRYHWLGNTVATYLTTYLGEFAHIMGQSTNINKLHNGLLHDIILKIPNASINQINSQIALLAASGDLQFFQLPKPSYPLLAKTPKDFDVWNPFALSGKGRACNDKDDNQAASSSSSKHQRSDNGQNNNPPSNPGGYIINTTGRIISPPTLSFTPCKKFLDSSQVCPYGNGCRFKHYIFPAEYKQRDDREAMASYAERTPGLSFTQKAQEVLKSIRGRENRENSSTNSNNNNSNNNSNNNNNNNRINNNNNNSNDNANNNNNNNQNADANANGNP